LFLEQEALSDADALAAKSLQAWAHVALGHILLMQGNTAAARAHSEQALSLEQSIGAGTEERETRYILADLAIEERRISDAREMLQELRNALDHRPNVDAELECLILQTKLALLEKQDAAALKTALRARAASTHSERLELQLSAAEVLALAAGASRQWAQADRVINSALGLASQSGCVACELKVQYSQCDLSEKRDASRSALCFSDLNTRAAARGFGLIARNAAAETAILAKGSNHLP